MPTAEDLSTRFRVQMSDRAVAMLQLLDEYGLGPEKVVEREMNRRFPFAYQRAVRTFNRYVFTPGQGGWVARGPGLPDHGPFEGNEEKAKRLVFLDLLRVMAKYSDEIAECNRIGDDDGVTSRMITINVMVGNR